MAVTAENLAVPGIDPSLIDSLSTAIIVLDGTQRVTGMNSAAESLLELSAKQVRGMPAAQLLPDCAMWAAALERVAAHGCPLTEREMQLPLLGGRVITVDCTCAPLQDAGRISGTLVELNQIDRHIRISREEQLLNQNEHARALVRGLAHEIRNPLGGLRGAAQLLERELKDEALKEYTGIIISEADRLQRLVDRMLGPRSIPQKRSLNVHEVIERVFVLVTSEAPQITVERDYDPSIPDVHADPELLIQAVLNVARNAIQALDGQGTLTFRTRVHRQLTIGHHHHRLAVCIAVADDGPGIPAELGETLFYPMVTGRAEGTGLGLSIAQSLVNQHGGLIECDRDDGITIFSIYLPVENA